MTSPLSPRLSGLTALAAVGVVAGLASGRPELVVLATPIVVLLVVALALRDEPRLAGTIDVDRVRVLEGDRVRVTVALRNEGNTALAVELAVLRSRHVALEPDGATLLRLPVGEALTIELGARAQRWGAHAIGPIVVRARDPFRVARWERELGRHVAVRAFPREQRLRELVAPLRTQPFLGAHVARARGEGIEFAEVRAFAAGDRVRRVNWRATARRGALYVTERHPEQASDVVLLLDTFAEARGDAGGTLDGDASARARNRSRMGPPRL